MRCSTVLVHGEALVIRKLVVAGIVSAERSYLSCLMVMKEVSTHWQTLRSTHVRWREVKYMWRDTKVAI